MRTWSIPSDGPYSLRLVADARVSVTDYVDDQVWDVVLRGGEPSVLAVETSYGLRARSMRIFPSVSLQGRSINDPDRFARPPSVARIAPDYVQVDFGPAPGLEASAEYWVWDSHVLRGRLTLRNVTSADLEPRLIIHALLRPDEKGSPMGPANVAGVNILSGRTEELAPVVFLTGGAEFHKGPYAGLAVSFALTAGEEHSVVWAEAALRDVPASFAAARAAAARPWEADLSRLERLNESMVEFETGDPDWDAALAMAQKTAVGSLLRPTHALPHPAFVAARRPDQGFSRLGDGTDYDGEWEGQDAGRAYLLSQAVNACAPDLSKGILLNFLATESVDGSVDRIVGLSGRRHPTQCAPLLASSARRVFEDTQDRDFLRQAYPNLLKCTQHWFHPAHDRDQDGWPEWDTPLQAMLEDHPAFVSWHEWGQGIDTTYAETVDLAAYLVHELDALAFMAEALGETAAARPLRERARGLSKMIEGSWEGQRAVYRHRDRSTHASPQGIALGGGQGSFTLKIGRRFDPPVRLLVRCHGSEAGHGSCEVVIRGQGQPGQGRLETLTQDDFRWFWGFGTATSGRAYSRIDTIALAGLSDEVQTEVSVTDFSRQDLSQLLPLWAGIPDQARADRIIRRTLLDPDRYWRPYGLPACSARDPAYRADRRGGAGGTPMLWNVMLGEALIDYGHRQEAADLLGRLMSAVVGTLRSEHAFRESYNPDRLEGLGARDDVAGLAPVGLMLRVLGVRLHSPRKIHIEGPHVLPWPVTLRWRGLQVTRQVGLTRVLFPNGEAYQVEGDQPQQIEQLD